MNTIRQLLAAQFGMTPTSQQHEAFIMIEKFLSADNGDRCFVLKGYAGTGKTTLISALVKVLPRIRLKCVLMAPTGRAAKVVSNYSGKKAFTIHKKIYRKKEAASPDMTFVLGQNIMEDTVFIIDEASMLTDQAADFNGHSVLHDLVKYVYSGKNCKLMLVGDTAQLPPVGLDYSPALNISTLKQLFSLDIYSYELTDVVRQQKESGILFNATQTRELIRTEKNGFPSLTVKSFKDVYRMTGERLVEGLSYAYDKFGMENTLVVCRSNKNANVYNQNIRNRILYREEELTGGDYIMVVRNNYFWLSPDETNGDFIANGDLAKIRKVKRIEEQYGFRFADVVIELVDYPDKEPLTCKVLLDTLYSETPSLSAADSKRLYEAVLKDYAHFSNRRMQMEHLKKDQFYNALQIKFAFAVTCHKAQGGQWDAVFIDQGFLTEEMVNTELLRWLYTGITRATKELFFVNFSDQFFKN